MLIVVNFDLSSLEVKTCEWWQFTCENGDCIDDRLVCNNHPDCRDRSDESDCDHHGELDCFITGMEHWCKVSVVSAFLFDIYYIFITHLLQ